jgi:hypothetical protein
MIENIKKLGAFVGGYMGGSFSVDIDFKKGSAKYDVYEHGYKPKSTETIMLSESKIKAFLKTLEKIKITEWKEHYPNPGIMDGTNWGIEINFSNNKKFSSSGDNAYPGQWKAFCNAIKGLLGKDFG